MLLDCGVARRKAQHYWSWILGLLCHSAYLFSAGIGTAPLKLSGVYQQPERGDGEAGRCGGEGRRDRNYSVAGRHQVQRRRPPQPLHLLEGKGERERRGERVQEFTTLIAVIVELAALSPEFPNTKGHLKLFVPMSAWLFGTVALKKMRNMREGPYCLGNVF